MWKTLTKMLRKVLIFIAIATSFTSAASTVDWWEDASLYQIYPRSWKDSNGDGTGDLKGITQKLEYLKEIGITATWLSPIFKSPMADNGYDISNFYEIDPLFGTMEEFKELLKKAKSLGIKIILDFVPNHSSDECEWFQKSVNREDGYDDFYVWDDGKDDPNNPGKKIPPSNWVSIFDGSMWEWNEKRQQFYLHQFMVQQPDFNFRNKKVHEAMLDVLKFWLDIGIDGFRIDAVPHMYERMNDDGTYPDEPLSGYTTDPNLNYYLNHIHTQNVEETSDLMYEWRAFLDDYQKKNGGETRVLLAEAYAPFNKISEYAGNATHKGVHIPFNFALIMNGLKEESNARVLAAAVDLWMEFMWKTHKLANWVMGNHDNMRLASKMGKDKKDLINIVIGTLPGASVTYYGEEIGMIDVKTCENCSDSESRSFSRTPFQWNDGVSAGFSTSKETWLPVADNYKTINVKVERGISRSTLNIFKKIKQLSKTPAFKAFKEEGGFSCKALNDNVYQIIRSSSSEEFRVLANMGKKTENIGTLLDSKVNDLVEYVLVTGKSAHNFGDKAKLRDVDLMPNEAVVLRKIQKL